MSEPQANPGAVKAAAEQGDPRAQMQMAQAAFRRGNKDEYRHWLQQAASRNFPPAMHQLGVWRLTQTLSPSEIEDAKGLVRNAAEKGFAPAIHAMSMFAAHGSASLPDWAEGIGWLKKALKLNDAQALRTAGLLLTCRSESAGLGDQLLIYAAAAGDPFACYHYGLRLAGSDQSRVSEAAFWLHRAHQAGHVLAGAAYKRLGSPAVSRPAGGLPKPAWEKVSAALDAVGEPIENFESKEILEVPRTRRVPNVLAEWECDYLIARAAPRLEPAMTSEALDKNQEASEYRTNSGAKFWMLSQDLVISRIDRKLALAAETPQDCAEDVVVLHYKPGERYFPHCDSFHPDLPEQAAEIDLKGQRIRTILVYLNEDYESGETHFLHADKKVKGKRGEAIVFENVTEDGAPDERAVHEGLPVTRGEKWLASKWVRDKSQVLIQ